MTATRSRSHLAVWVAVPVAVLVLLLVALFATRDTGDAAATSHLVGELAPAIESEATDGSTFVLDDHRGQWVLVNMFATWCVPCIDEHPELVAFSEANPDVAVVSVAFDDDPETVAEFFERNGGEWPVLLDSTIAIDWAVAQVPESFLVAPNGRVAAHLLGGVTAADLEEAIADLEGSG